MISLTRRINPIALVLVVSCLGFGANPAPEEFLRTKMQLSNGQLAKIQKGSAVAKILPSSDPAEILVFGAVYIRSKPAAYLQFMQDITRKKQVAGYLAAGEFSAPPTVGDMDGLSLEHDDIEDLRNCRPGDCELQLPSESMEAARASIDWNSPNVAEKVNILAKRKIISLLAEYQQSGDRVLGAYHDKHDPISVAQHFRSLLSHVEYFPQYLPDLNRYLLDYPNSRPDGAQGSIYWEKVDFGLKPTIRVNHVTFYRASNPEHQVYVLAIKQLYATHYFQTALDLSFCIQGSEAGAENGFYLMTVKASRQAGLTGVKGGLLRKIVVDKTRSSLEAALNSIRQNLEHRIGSPGVKDNH